MTRVAVTLFYYAHLKISLAFTAFSFQDSLMTKRALSAVAGFLGLCLPLSAQQTYRPDLFSALNNSISLPSLSLSDGQRFSFSGAVAAPFSFSWMEPTTPDFLPALSTTVPSRATVARAYPKDSSKEVVWMCGSPIFLIMRPEKWAFCTGDRPANSVATLSRDISSARSAMINFTLVSVLRTRIRTYAFRVSAINARFFADDAR